MTRAERLELALIPLAAAAAWGVAARLPDAPGLGDLLLAGAVLLLLQGLLRDLWLLWRRRALAAAAQPRRMPCLCLESALGATGVLAGLVFLGSGLAWRMAMRCCGDWPRPRGSPCCHRAGWQQATPPGGCRCRY